MRFFCNGNDHNTGTIEDDGYITVQLEDRGLGFRHHAATDGLSFCHEAWSNMK